MPTKSNTLPVPHLRLIDLEVRIIGTTPLITNRFSEEAADDMERDQGGGAKELRAPRDPQRIFDGSRYRDDAGRDVFPAGAIKEALIDSAMRHAGEVGTHIRGAITVPTEWVLIEGPEPRMRRDRVVHGGKTKTTSLAYRAVYDPWSMAVPFRIVDPLVSDQKLMHFLRLAGYTTGIGAWRQEKHGIYGLFEVEPEIRHLAERLI